MAREPYRGQMLTALTSGTKEQQEKIRLEFMIEEAGSSHSDVVAAMNAERIRDLVLGKLKTYRIESNKEPAYMLDVEGYSEGQAYEFGKNKLTARYGLKIATLGFSMKEISNKYFVST